MMLYDGCYFHHPNAAMPPTMKRKGFDDADDDFSDFSIPSPARKIRRLDADLPPIVEENDRDVPIVTFGSASAPDEPAFPVSASAGGLKIEELPSLPENNERAIVLFNPNANANPLSLNPSNYLVSINPQLISGLKNRELWSSELGSWKLADQQSGLTKDEDDSNSDNASLAVVPWVPLQNFPEVSPKVENFEMLDADEALESSGMDVENESSFHHSNAYGEAVGNGMMTSGEGLHQWPQQHCMIPQPTNNLSTPMFWYR